MTEPVPTYNVPAPEAPAPGEPPSPVAAFLDLVAQLPPDLQASDRDSNHFELVTPTAPDSYWWLDVGDLLDKSILANPEAMYMDLDLDRLQFLLDLASAAKAAEQQLRATLFTIAEHERFNRLRGDMDAYLLALIEWSRGELVNQPNPADYGL